MVDDIGIDGGTSEKADEPVKKADEPANEFTDLTHLRLGQDFGEKAGVKKALITVPVRKPDKQAFIRVHPDPTYRLDTATITMKEDREVFLIHPTLWSELAGEIVPTALFTTITKQGVVFLWPVRLPAPDGRLDPWSRSALDSAEMAKTTWLSVKSNKNLGAYEPYVATGNFPEPEWPEVTFQKLVEVAFREHYIKAMEHPIIRMLRGEM